MHTTFIYCPQSGDRVFSTWLLPEHGLRLVTWPNGCRHVQGGLHLYFEAQGTPRQGVRTLAAAFVQACGGVAWDEQGTINLVVPPQHAWQVHEAFCRLLGQEHRNLAAQTSILLVAAGVATLVAEDGLLWVRPTRNYKAEDLICHPETPLPRYRGDVAVEVDGVGMAE